MCSKEACVEKGKVQVKKKKSDRDGVVINLWNKVEFFGRGGKEMEVGNGKLVHLVSERGVSGRDQGGE